MVNQVMKTGLGTQTGKINSGNDSELLQFLACVYKLSHIYHRCQCGGCVAMPTNIESVCCCEIDRKVAKKGEMKVIFSA